MNWFRFFAWLAIVLHTVGLAAAAFGIRPGTSVFPVETRMAYLSGGIAWQLSWGVWLLAALSFIAFLATLKGRFALEGTLANFALMVGVAAVSVDSCCDILQIVVLPSITGKNVFIAIAAIASSGGIIVANGFYCIAVVLMTCALGNRVPKSVTVLGWIGLITGLALSIAGFFNEPRAPEWFTGPAIVSYILWLFMLDRTQ